MLRVNILICLLLMFAVTACTPTYTHPTKTSADFERDYKKCTKIAEQISCNNYKMCGNPLIISSERRKCLESKFGWRRK